MSTFCRVLPPGRVLLAAAVLAACAGDPAVVEPPVTDPPALRVVATGLSRPVLAVAPPGDSGRLFIVEQTGAIRVMHGDTLQSRPFLDLSTLVTCCGEQGLLGLAFHPRYGQTGHLYVNYTDAGGTTRVVRYTVSAADPDSADAGSAFPILSQSQPFSNHNGGMLAFGPDDYLYIGFGDGGSGGDPQGNGQDLTTWLGKVLRVDVDGGTPYAVPPTNPYAGSTTARPEIWASGLRNPWRFSFDRVTGDLYIADVGQNAREEVNVEPAGAGGRNYGWNLMEGTVCFQPACSPLGLTMPVIEYVNPDEGCAVTGGYVYRGSAVPALAGRYLYADFCQGWVRSFRWTGGAAQDPRDWPGLAPGGPVSSFGEDGRGELYVLEYLSSGVVYRIVPSP